MTARPPRLAGWLLRTILVDQDRDYIIGDLAEQYRETVLPRSGWLLAQLWYWRQVWQSIGPSKKQRRFLRRAEDVLRTPSNTTKSSSMESLRQDLLFALRQLRRSPGFALTVILTLALGIGANTAIFSVVHGTLMRPLPYRESDRLVAITTELRDAPEAGVMFASPDFADLRDQTTTLQHVVGISETVVLPLSGIGESENVKISRVTWDFFDALGVPSLLGRVFRAMDGIPVQQDSALRPLPLVISNGLWQRKFGSDPGAIGRTMRINGWPAEIVGVMPASFRVLLPNELELGTDFDVWWPSRYDHSTGSRDGYGYRVIGRLVDGVRLTQAQQELAALAERLKEQFITKREAGLRFHMELVHDSLVAPMRTTLMVFLGAVGFVLLIACANVANLLLARGSSRRGELAVRAALGAGRWRIVRQILTENAVLSLVGAIGGVALGHAGIIVLKLLSPPELPRIDEVGLHPTVLAFTLGATVLATLLYTVIPAIQYSRAGLLTAERGMTSSKRRRGVQDSLAITEVALTIVLLVGTGLMIRSFIELTRVPLGFEMDGLLTIDTNNLGGTREERHATEDEIERRIAELPGVRAVGNGFPLPMNGVYGRVAEYTPEELRDDPNARREAFFRTVSPTYLDAMGIELLLGRGFTRADNDTARSNVIVDQRFAEREWPGENPIGKRIALFGWGFDRWDYRYEVVGVVEFVPQWDHRDPRPTIYVTRYHYYSIETSIAVRAAGDPAALIGPVTQVIKSINPDMPIHVVAMRDLVSDALAPTRFVLTLIAVFSGMALVLASVGLYGVLSYTVRQRTREIGIRMAFGARSANMVREVLYRGASLAGVGLAVGLGGSLMLGRLLDRHLFQISTTDPLSFLGTAAVVGAVTVAASYIPARRAASVDPMVALRVE